MNTSGSDTFSSESQKPREESRISGLAMLGRVLGFAVLIGDGSCLLVSR